MTKAPIVENSQICHYRTPKDYLAFGARNFLCKEHPSRHSSNSTKAICLSGGPTAISSVNRANKHHMVTDVRTDTISFGECRLF